MAGVFTVAGPTHYEGESIKGSRFVASVVPVSTHDAVRASIEGVRVEHPDASHHCWASRLASPAWERACDDGEPSGSAGRPILSALQGRALVDVCVVVSRYFGGTKLGVGGLVRAYGGAAIQALEHATRVEYVVLCSCRVDYDYADGPAVDAALAEFSVRDDNVEYAARISRCFDVPCAELEALRAALCDRSAGRVVLWHRDEGGPAAR